MKKICLTLGLAGVLVLPSYAQLTENAVAPDFTLTDINGVSHNLYSYLDSGYSVLIDVSATWCGPCWNGHQSDFMNKLEAEYGTNGTVSPGKIKVIFIEGDPSTTSSDLHGTGSNTRGDWVSNQSYIIIDDDAVNSYYLNGGFPTYTIVAPNRRVQLQLPGFDDDTWGMGEATFWAPYFENAPSKVSGDNVGVIHTATKSLNCIDPTVGVNLQSEIQNLGTNPVTSATITASINNTVIATKNWTGNLANTYDAEVIDFGNFPVGNEPYAGGLNTIDVVYDIAMPGDNNARDNTLIKPMTFASPTQSRDLILKMKTDANPTQNAWGILNADGTQVLREETFTAADANKEFEFKISLNAGGCYFFVVVDGAGDGMESGGGDPAYLKLYEADGTTLIEEFPLNFGSRMERFYRAGLNSATAIEDAIVSTESIQIYPNPASDQISVDFYLEDDAQVVISLVNLLGQSVGERTPKGLKKGNNLVNLDISELPAGVYLLQVHSAARNYHYKFTKQ